MNRKRAEIIRNEVFRRRKSKTICIVPAAACAPPKLNEDASVVNDLRVKTLSLSSISGLTGLPEVVVPCVSNKNELPIGVGFIGWEHKIRRKISFTPAPREEVVNEEGRVCISILFV